MSGRRFAIGGRIGRCHGGVVGLALLLAACASADITDFDRARHQQAIADTCVSQHLAGQGGRATPEMDSLDAASVHIRAVEALGSGSPNHHTNTD